MPAATAFSTSSNTASATRVIPARSVSNPLSRVTICDTLTPSSGSSLNKVSRNSSGRGDDLFGFPLSPGQRLYKVRRTTDGWSRFGSAAPPTNAGADRAGSSPSCNCSRPLNTVLADLPAFGRFEEPNHPRVEGCSLQRHLVLVKRVFRVFLAPDCVASLHGAGHAASSALPGTRNPIAYP